MARTDIHRPSAINPEEYVFVAMGYVGGGAGMDLEVVMAEKRRFAEHMAKTGGKFSTHEHGGTCHICGAHALYTVRFYHAKTNVYITTGTDCAEKLEMGNAIEFRSFRERVKAGLEAAAGKAKAQATLTEKGMERAWNIYAEKDGETIEATMVNPRTGEMFYEETTIRDIVGKLVAYGSVSEKQENFLRSLLTKIDARNARAVEQAAQAATAKDLPVSDARLTITGVVLSTRTQDSPYGLVTKMLVQHADGWKVWGTKPSGHDIEKGDTVTFTARVTKSNDDSKFGFFSRPTKVSVTKKEVPSV